MSERPNSLPPHPRAAARRWLCPQNGDAWWVRPDDEGGWWVAREPDHRPFRVAASAPLCLHCGATLADTTALDDGSGVGAIGARP